MAFCPGCKAEIEDSVSSCYVCGLDLEKPKDSEWIILGSIEDKISSDYARETLKSEGIPIVIISKSGFFGEVGLTLNPFHKDDSGLFEVRVPNEYKEEAIGILEMILGERFQEKK